MPLEILVVDDIAESRVALCGLLEDLGHKAFGVDSGEAALARVERFTPDLVLLDLLMPGLDGFEVTRRLRALSAERWLPVIVTSSLEGDEHFIHALDHGADDYLVRPVNASLLNAKLRHYARVLSMQGHLAVVAQRQRDILDNILDAVVTLDAEGRVEEMNLAAQTLFVGERPATGPLDCEQLLGADLATLLSQRECTLHARDGREFSAEVGLSEWRDAGRVRYTLALRDLTERQQITRMKDEFLATVSHELRTPLTSVLGALGLLAGGAAGSLPEAARQLAEVAQRNGARLSRLIDDILDLTRLEGDRLLLQRRPQPLAPLLREALAAAQLSAAAAGVTLLGEGLEAEGLPPLAIDGERLQQVLGNLLSNAIKHSPSGETVRLALSRVGQLVRITVRDRGPGVAPEFRSRVFEKFSQADSTDRRSREGSGLGLYISRLLIERMGGRIMVDGPAGAGASFSIEFPIRQVADEPLRVLHVEGDFALRERVARWLAPVARVEGVARLSQAGQGAGASAPQLVIGNPQAQGGADEFCAGLRRLAAGAPVLLYSDSVDAAFAHRTGLRWLSPARSGPEELLAAARAALGGHSAGGTA